MHSLWDVKIYMKAFPKIEMLTLSQATEEIAESKYLEKL